MELKVVSYNILDGFHTREAPFHIEHERLNAARELMRQAKPGILVLTETCKPKITGHCVSIQYREVFGFDYCFHGPKPNGSKHGISILSHIPFTDFPFNYSMVDQKFVRAHFPVGNKNLCIDAVHPHPKLNELQKTQFFENVIRDRHAPYVLLGDFNSWSPQDRPFDRQSLIEKFMTFSDLREHPRGHIEHIVDNLLSCEAIQVLERRGLIDSFRKIHPAERAYTIPTDLSDPIKKAAVRLDYIFCSPDVKIVDAGIIRGPLAEKASDHYPVYAVLDI